MKQRYRVGWILLLALVAGCAAAAESGTSRNLEVLQREEILAANRSTAFDVVEMLRPQWLRTRSDQSVNREGGILIYMDDVRFGGLESLRSINANDVWLMQRYNATAASQRWGPGHSEGVIVVSTRPTR